MARAEPCGPHHTTVCGCDSGRHEHGWDLQTLHSTGPGVAGRGGSPPGWARRLCPRDHVGYRVVLCSSVTWDSGPGFLSALRGTCCVYKETTPCRFLEAHSLLGPGMAPLLGLVTMGLPGAEGLVRLLQRTCLNRVVPSETATAREHVAECPVAGADGCGLHSHAAWSGFRTLGRAPPTAPRPRPSSVVTGCQPGRPIHWRVSRRRARM